MTTPSALIADAGPGTTWRPDPSRSRLTFPNKTFWGAHTIKGRLSEIEGVAVFAPGAAAP